MEAHLSAARVHRLIGGLYATLSVALLLLFIYMAASSGDASIMVGAIGVVGLMLVPATIHLLIARAAARGDGGGKTASTIVAVLMLFGFPIGTAIGAYLLYLASQNWDVPKRPRMSSAELASAFPTAAPAMAPPTIGAGDRPA
jgi:hypothetical protein